MAESNTKAQKCAQQQTQNQAATVDRRSRRPVWCRTMADTHRGLVTSRRSTDVECRPMQEDVCSMPTALDVAMYKNDRPRVLAVQAGDVGGIDRRCAKKRQ